MWSSYNPFYRIDIYEFDNFLELVNHRMTIANEKLTSINDSYSLVDLNETRLKINRTINNKEFVSFEEFYDYVYPLFQDYCLFYGEFKNYFLQAHIYLPKEFNTLDQLNLHLQKYKYDIFPKDEEDLYFFELLRLENKYDGTKKYVYFDFLDSKISFKIFNKIYEHMFDSYSSLEEKIRKLMWIDSVSKLYSI